MFNEALNVKEAGISGVFGAIAGYTVKKFTRSISIAVGTGVVTASALSRSDLIRVNWNKVEDMLVKYGDIDGDGLVTKSDFNLIAKRLTEKAASKFPSLTSTITSFVIGYRLG
ncbi:hypothetical protein BC833DRAFT_529644 [Globomyces pollinis-pini]|nr:hypothetical protein BC833DRAFT_529644 [Globomyces pollinis-pini]